MVMSLKQLNEMRGQALLSSRVPTRGGLFYEPTGEALIKFVVKTMRSLGAVLFNEHPRKAKTNSIGPRGEGLQSWLHEGDEWARMFQRVEDLPRGPAGHVLQGLQGCWNVVSSPYTRAR